MRLILLFCVVTCGAILVSCQSDGQYRPPSTVRTTNRYFTRPTVGSNTGGEGRYRGGGDGRYRPGGDGRYRGGNDGRYVPKDDGKYLHVGDGFRGVYSGGGGEYTGSGGEYTGGGGQYTGGGGQYVGGDNGGGKYTGTGNTGSGGGSYDGNFKDGLSKPGSGTDSASDKGLGLQNGPRSGQGNNHGSDQGSGQGSGKGNLARTTERTPTSIQSTRAYKPTPSSGDGKSGWKIIRDEKSEDLDGYHYLYETENGILAEESGRIENFAPDENGLRSKGFFEYTGDDGLLYRVEYIADNNGFVPKGDHLPKVPDHIPRLLEYLASHTS